MSEIKITKCPPGAAYGADDLQNWAKRRLAGRSGIRMTKKKRKAAAEKAERQDDAAYWLKRHDGESRNRCLIV